jgi:hypothetical protein
MEAGVGMKLYGRRFADRYMDRKTRKTAETRDAILWALDHNSNTAQVKIQGSGKLLTAHFPRNWKRTPYWAKPGQSVRILHRTGVRGYVEVIGEGRAIPTPVEGAQLPPVSPPPDRVVAGGDIYIGTGAATPSTAYITGTTYQIDGDYYELCGGQGAPLGDEYPEGLGYMGGGQPMDGCWSHVTLDDIGTCFIRYDALAVGVDGVLDYIKGLAVVGTNSGVGHPDGPVKPTIPTGHVQIGEYILVWRNHPNWHEVDQDTAPNGLHMAKHAQEWDVPHMDFMYVYVSVPGDYEWSSGGDLHWDYPPHMQEMCCIPMTASYFVSLWDQYQCYYFPHDPNYTKLLFESITGTGNMWSHESGWKAHPPLSEENFVEQHLGWPGIATTTFRVRMFTTCGCWCPGHLTYLCPNACLDNRGHIHFLTYFGEQGEYKIHFFTDFYECNGGKCAYWDCNQAGAPQGSCERDPDPCYDGTCGDGMTPSDCM